MPYVDPQTVNNPTTGQVAPASWGDAVRDATQYLSGGFPHASILESTPQSLTSAVEADLTSNEENSDIGGMHSTSSNTERMTVPTGEGGLYRASAVVKYDPNTTGYRVLAFRINDTTNYEVVSVAPAPTGVSTTLSGSRSFVLSAGDFVTCRVFQNSGGALNCQMIDFTVEWRATA